MSTEEPIFSREKLKENHRGVEDLIPSTISEFLTYIPEMQEDLATAYKNNATADLTLAAHSLKGAIASVCSEPLRMLAYRIETLSKNNSKEEIKPLISELDTGIQKLKIDLEAFKKELTENGN